MDFVFFIPPPPFYEGTLADFEPTLDTCWFGRVVLLCRFRVKTDMKDDKGRSVLMDCDCALIDCLYDFAPGGYKCIFVCQSKTLSKQCANLHQTMYKPLSYMFKHTPNCIKTLQTFNKLCANQLSKSSAPQEHPPVVEGGWRERDKAALSARAEPGHLHGTRHPYFGKAASGPRG